MQSLYAHSIGYMVSTGSLTNRLGGLYCLYCLHETQPFKPPFRIYLSLGELRRLKSLYIDAKSIGVKIVSSLMNSMLEKNMFLFGYVGENEGSAAERVDELTDIQNARVQAAYNKLFANSRLEHFIRMDLGVELDVDLLKKRSLEYAAAKELAIKEASQVIDIQNIKHIAENKILIGDMVEKTAADWDSQKELFYRQTGFDHRPTSEPSNGEESDYFERRKSDKKTKQMENLEIREGGENVEDQVHDDDDDDFGKALEDVLMFEPLDIDDGEMEYTDNWDEDL